MTIQDIIELDETRKGENVGWFSLYYTPNHNPQWEARTLTESGKGDTMQKALDNLYKNLKERLK